MRLNRLNSKEIAEKGEKNDIYTTNYLGAIEKNSCSWELLKKLSNVTSQSPFDKTFSGKGTTCLRGHIVQQSEKLSRRAIPNS